MRNFLICVLFFASFAVADMPCTEENESKLSQVESDLIEVKVHYLESNEIAYEIYFPSEFQGRQLKSTEFWSGNLDSPSLILGLASTRSGEKYYSAISTLKSWDKSIYVKANYGACIYLGRRVKNT